ALCPGRARGETRVGVAARGCYQSRVAVAFSPLVARWFEERFGTPTPAQAAGWPAIARGADTLIAAPTGSGKTLAAFLWSLDRLLRAAGTGGLEALSVLLPASGRRRWLAAAQTVIVDEIHAVAADKRGAHLALSLERLDALAGRRLQRIGLSATQRPIEEVARLLVGAGAPRPCAIVDVGHRRALDLAIEIPDQELGPIATHELWADIYERIVAQVRTHRTTIVFVNTRRLV